jgi:hypothetical protein
VVLRFPEPSRGHVVVATELLMAIHAILPRGMRVYPDWGLHTPLGDFEPDLMVAPDDLPDESYAAVPPLLVVTGAPTAPRPGWPRPASRNTGDSKFTRGGGRGTLT